MECWGDGAKSVEMTASHYDDKSFFLNTRMNMHSLNLRGMNKNVCKA
jgi:hypothetical protein